MSVPPFPRWNVAKPVLDIPQVALLIETARGYGRDVALGIARYSRLHGPWSFNLRPGDFEQAMPAREHWRGDGAFARLATDEIGRQLLEAGLPTVALDMSDDDTQPDNPLHVFTDLRVDSSAAAALAAAHLLDLRRSAYGFVGSPGKIWSERRESAFCEIIHEQGFQPHVFRTSSPPGRGFWGAEAPLLAEWIESLPKPIGLMACNDEHGLYVLDACRQAGARVPEDVAVVGVDNDTLMCELCNPTLSSVVLNGIEGGYQAAAHLDKLMREGANHPGRIIVGAMRVEPRQSTDLVGFENHKVAEAVAYIKRTNGQKVTAELVADQVEVSRRELDKHFQSDLGRSIAAEIQRVRLEHARRLLEETDHPIPHVAEAAGYSSASYMIQVFRRELSTTPSKYRSRVRTLSVEGLPKSGLL